jgi:SAM-dependent methyltransferase
MPDGLGLSGGRRGTALRRDLVRRSPVAGHLDPLPASASHLEMNRVFWTKEAARYAERAPDKWAAREITWGVWATPESRVNVLGNVAGLDVIDLGCGTGYFSAWLARANGFDVEDLIELQAPVGAQSPFELVSSEWAHRWPSEEIWVARKAD